jgi:hypothetical protein
MFSSTPRPLYPWGNSPHTYSVRGRIGPRTGLNSVAKRKIPASAVGSTMFSFPYSAASHTDLTFFYLLQVVFRGVFVLFSLKFAILLMMI